MAEFYTGKTCGGQGVVIEQGTGRDVALVYDIGDTALLAAAPSMLALLHIMANETEASGKPSARTLREARQLFCDLPEPDFSIFAHAAKVAPAAFTFSRWRHGGWYVDQVRYPDGACGCVSRNYEDRRWRIVCDPRPFDERPTFTSRDDAARAEWELANA